MEMNIFINKYFKAKNKHIQEFCVSALLPLANDP